MTRTALVALLALASGPALAGHEPPDWRIGVAAIFPDFSEDVSGVNYEDASVGVKFYGQYQFNEWFGVEGAYHDTGDLEDFSPDLDSEIGVSFDGISLQGLLYLPWKTEDLQPYLKAGYFDFDDELTVGGDVVSNGSESGIVAGAGAIMSITDRFGIRADFDWFDADVGDLWSVNLGVEYYFGGVKKAAPAAAAVPAAAAPVAAAAGEAPPADGDGVAEDADACAGTADDADADARGCGE